MWLTRGVHGPSIPDTNRRGGPRPKVDFQWISILSILYLIYLYYKERRQLKTFLTQIGFVLPLTPDPTVICFLKWIMWKDYEVQKIEIWTAFLPKN
jgi:hypothetical protein